MCVTLTVPWRVPSGHRFSSGATRLASGNRFSPTSALARAISCASGVFAAAAGVLLAGFVQAGFVNIAKGMEVDAIAAAVIGGTALFGGRGEISGTVLGVLILGVLNTGLLVLQAPTNEQLIVKGALVILALTVSEQLRKRVAIR